MGTLDKYGLSWFWFKLVFVFDLLSYDQIFRLFWYPTPKQFSSAQPVFTCWNSTMETQEQYGNMFKVNNKDARTTSMTSFLCLYCYLWTYFTRCFGVSYIDFELVNAGWQYLINSVYNEDFSYNLNGTEIIFSYHAKDFVWAMWIVCRIR